MTRMLTVAQVARRSGVTIRTLHHYDRIGLLKPAAVGSNGYRYYGTEELLRLQQILLHRELGMPLADIAAVLDAPGFNRLAALREQRRRLDAEARRFAMLVETIDRTIAGLEGEEDMTEQDLYAGTTGGKQAEYEAWLIEKYGGDMPDRIARSRKKYEALSEAERHALMDELRVIETDWAEAMRTGVPATSAGLDPLLSRHRAWVSAMWDRPCSPRAYGGLADLHLSHPDFVARYEAIAEGFSDYHAAAMKAYADRLAA